MDIDMSDVVDCFDGESYTIKTLTQTQDNDFNEVNLVSGRTQDLMVQPADPKKLIGTNINYRLEYLMIHSLDNISIDEYVEKDNKDFKVIQKSPWSAYGYTEVVAEETAETPLVVNN